MPRGFVRALGLIKWAAAAANRDLELLSAGMADAIKHAASEVAEGQHDEHFPVDVFSNGIRHQFEHERQRSDRQPRQPPS